VGKAGKRLRKLRMKALRDNMKKDGFFDGRFKAKVEPNKKKERKEKHKNKDYD
jgi:hypothetical protein